MPTTPNMGMVLPVEGASDDVWDTLINAALTVNDAHDHSAGKGVRITPSGLNINADLALANAPGITGVGRLDFTPIAALAAGAGVLFQSNADNELYWRSQGGVNVKVTSGASLNVSIVGGIAGDYSAVSAEVAFVDANDNYTFKQQVSAAVRQWARMASGDVDLYEYKAAGDPAVATNRVRLASPAALAASYALTFPAAVPASTVAVQVSSAGVLTFSNTFATLITASAGVTAAANQHITVSGTGEYKHGDRILAANAQALQIKANWTRGDTIITSSGIGDAYWAPQMLVGDQPKSLTVLMAGDGAADITIDVFEQHANGTSTNRGTLTVNNAGAGPADQTLDFTDFTIAAGEAIVIRFTSSAANIVITNVRLTYDHP
jgi:hypothetical protein